MEISSKMSIIPSSSKINNLIIDEDDRISEIVLQNHLTLRNRYLSFVVIFIFSCLFLVIPTFAQGDSSGTTLLVEAERLWKEGVLLAKKQRYQQALIKFRASLRLVPNEKKYAKLRGAVEFFVGYTYHKLKQWLQARDHYRVYLNLQPKGRYVGSTQKWLKEIYPKIWMSIQLLNAQKAHCVAKHPAGIWKGVAPHKFKGEAGKLTLVCSRKGFYPYRQTFVIKRQEERKIKFILKAKPKALPPKLSPDRRWFGLIVGGLGIATIGIGGFWGMSANSLQAKAIDIREKKSQNASEDALNFRSQAEQDATLANIFYVTGAILTATGAVLYLTLGSKVIPTPLSSEHSKHAKVFVLSESLIFP